MRFWRAGVAKADTDSRFRPFLESQGFGVNDRVRSKREFDRAYKDGKRLVCEWFVAFVCFSSDGPFRVGVVASRRVGGAVARNRAKRLLREVYRRNKPQSAVSGYLVLVARHAIGTAGYRVIETAYGESVGRFLEAHR